MREAAEKVLDARARPSLASGLDRGPLRELHLLTAKPFLYVFNLDEDELGATRPCAPSWLHSWPPRRRSSSTRRSRRSSSRGMSDEDALEAAGSRWGNRRRRAAPARADRLRHARTADVPDRGAEGGPGVDDPQGRHRSRGGRRHPHRFPARVHQGRGHRLRRPHGGRLDGRRPAPPARPAWRARTTSCRTATWWSSASTSDLGRRCRRSARRCRRNGNSRGRSAVFGAPSGQRP